MRTIILTILLCVSLNISYAQVAKKGKVAPDFKVETDHGEFHLNEVLKEKHVLLNIASVGCGYSMISLLHLEQYQEYYKDRVQIITIYNREDGATAKDVTAHLKRIYQSIPDQVDIPTNIPMVWGGKFIDELYPTKGWPSYYLIEKGTGKVVKKWFGGNPDKIGKALKKITK